MKKLFASPSSLKVLAVGAHPDDVEVGAGGLVSRLAQAGAEVQMVVVSVPTLSEQRHREAEQGAAILGARSLILCGDRQCRVEDLPMHELVRRLDMVVADLQPDLVITHSAHDLHWDHGLVHRAVLSSLRRFSCDLLAFLSSSEMNAQSRSLGQCFVDITATVETKLEAIRAHASQLPRLDLESSRDLARAMGRLSGVEFAELYEVLRLHV
jgi:LmbE family N-acetylglucosaminyl deacetylase